MLLDNGAQAACRSFFVNNGAVTWKARSLQPTPTGNLQPLGKLLGRMLKKGEVIGFFFAPFLRHLSFRFRFGRLGVVALSAFSSPSILTFVFACLFVFRAGDDLLCPWNFRFLSFICVTMSVMFPVTRGRVGKKIMHRLVAQILLLVAYANKS